MFPQKRRWEKSIVNQQVACLDGTPTTFCLASHPWRSLECCLRCCWLGFQHQLRRFHRELQDNHSPHPHPQPFWWPKVVLRSVGSPRRHCLRWWCPRQCHLRVWLRCWTCQADHNAKSVGLLNLGHKGPCSSSGKGSCPGQSQGRQQKGWSIGRVDHGKSSSKSDSSMLLV